MTPQEFERLLKDMERDVDRFISTDAPAYAAEQAVKMFKENFQREGFFGSKWKEVQRRKASFKRNGKTIKNNVKGAKRTRKILTGDTADLGRGVKKKITGYGSAEVYGDVKYARVHNEGLMAGRGKGKFKMPKRQFIGNHPRLNKAIVTVLEKRINDLFKKYK